jgi:hypothetical protein
MLNQAKHVMVTESSPLKKSPNISIAVDDVSTAYETQHFLLILAKNNKRELPRLPRPLFKITV